MSLIRSTPAAVVLAAGLALAGCGSSAPAAIGPATTPSAPPSSTAASPTTSAASTGGQPASASKCTYDDLQASVGRTTGDAGQRHTTVVWKNETGRACTMFGFGGVDLDGPPYPGQPATFSLVRTSKEPATVRLEPGASAHTTITWVSGGNWTPTKILATPPDETRAAPLDWPGGTVLRQDGATHPGSYIDPVRSGAED